MKMNNFIQMYRIKYLKIHDTFKGCLVHGNELGSNARGLF